MKPNVCRIAAIAAAANCVVALASTAAGYQPAAICAIVSLAATAIAAAAVLHRAITEGSQRVTARLEALERMIGDIAASAEPVSSQYLVDMAEAIRVGRELERRSQSAS